MLHNKQLLQSKRRELETIAQALLKKEILHKDDLDALIGKRPFEDMELHALSSVAALHTIIN